MAKSISADVIPAEKLENWIVKILEEWAPGEDVGFVYLFRAVSSDHQDENGLLLTLSRVTHACLRLIDQGRIYKTYRGHVIGPSEKARRDARRAARVAEAH